MNFGKYFASSPRLAAFVVAFCSLAVYLKTLAPTVSFIDSGELATVACTLGIAHPSGYPLFTMLGWVFTRFPLGSEAIVRLNIMVAAFCSAGVYVFFHLMRFILGELTRLGARGESFRQPAASSAVIVSSAAASLMLAFSETYWSQAVAVEVYALHVLFLSLVTFSFVKAAFWNPEGNRWWMVFAYVLGLSFTNHMTTILLAPGLLYLYFATQGGRASSWKRIGLMSAPFLLGLSVYLYLPVRAAQGPDLNWGNTVTVERFLWHLSGKQYRVWIFSSPEAAGRQLKYFLDSLPGEFAYVGLPLALVGAVILWRAHRKLFLTLVLFFVTCVVYSINYDIHDIDSYFLLAYFCLALWAGIGVFQVFRWITAQLGWKIIPATIVVLVFGLVPCVVNYPKTDESNQYLVEDYTRNMFSSFQPDALVLSYQWDYWVSASYYYQIVKGVRPDVVVIDKELLRRSWYLTELAYRYPLLVKRSQREVDSFRKELDKFEHELPYDGGIIQARYVEMIRSFIKRNLDSRPVYVTAEIEPEFTEGFQRVPEGLALRLFSDTLSHRTESPSFGFRPFARPGRLEDMVKRLYSNALTTRGEYLYRKDGNLLEAEAAFKQALAYDANSPEARSWLARLGR
jgi:hypothetical protein